MTDEATIETPVTAPAVETAAIVETPAAVEPVAPVVEAPAIEEAPEVVTHESFVQGLKDLLHTVETGAEDIINYVESKIHKIQA